MVILKGYIVVPESDLETVKLELSKHVELTREEQGCLVFSVEQRQDNLRIFDVYEEFKDSDAFDSHQERSKNSLWDKVTKNVKRYYKINET